uniref:Peptidase S1 domain-containing protein n=1 Tax=Ditylenchus dipsaci TaxID=166011 RepID=A0A915CPK4_9BILA
MHTVSFDFAMFDGFKEVDFSDFTIIQLHIPIPDEIFESGKVRIACLPESKKEELPPKIIAAGWGRDNSGSTTTHLKYTQLNHTLEKCVGGAPTQFCAYEKDRRSYQDPQGSSVHGGDSGGGAVYYSEQNRCL